MTDADPFRQFVDHLTEVIWMLDADLSDVVYRRFKASATGFTKAVGHGGENVTIMVGTLPDGFPSKTTAPDRA